MLNQAQILYARGDPAGALEAANVIVPRIGGSLAEGDPTAAAALQVQGLALDSLRRFDEAEAPLRRSLEIRKKYLPPTHWAIASSESVVGYHLGLVKRYPESVRILAQAYADMVERRGAEVAATKRVAHRLAEVYGRWGRPADSASWMAKAR